MASSRMLVDGGAIINLMSYSFYKKMGKSDEELIKINMIITKKEEIERYRSLDLN
jgi:hypothetical protein